MPMPREDRTGYARRRLGSSLRQLREATHREPDQVSAGLGWPAERLPAIERGLTGASGEEIGALLEHLGAGPDERAALTELGRAAVAGPTLSERYRAVLSAPFAEFLAAEEAARAVRHYEPILIPGPLQTLEYARAVLSLFAPDGEAGPPAPDAAALRTEARMARARLLLDDPGVDAQFVVDETALMRAVGTEAGAADVMAGQLAHLEDLAAAPNISISVAPARAGLYTSLLRSPFVVLEFDDDERLAYFEHAGGERVVHDRAGALNPVLEAFEQMRRLPAADDLRAALSRARAALDPSR
ncbi:helix-turn-helix domain-containing protein [Dactylosporangium sp. CS-033363]|uniref:helix-turn-helix domain-containing protein n=1 Tax=Dactylosporangium sp. CS-033363 TaxID=3239935 RepID=UPI003D92DB56